MSTKVLFSNSNSKEIKAYRPDIDGLRAVAVLSVIVFHFWPKALESGFVGVDIFFVISGFLISGIILKDIEKDQFSYLHFFGKRVRRIFPALVLVLLFTFIASASLLFASERTEISKQIIAGALFSYNFLAAKGTGYFEGLQIGKPLLHLWSLGIEEQFYFVWPFILTFFWPRKGGKYVFAAAFLFSFLLNVVFVERSPAATFYYPFTRFWELIIGAFLAMWVLQAQKLPTTGMSAWSGKTRNIISAVGVILILGSLVFINHNVVFPGANALFPTLGAACILLAGPTAFFNRLIANPVFVFVGLISYPLYLWHWTFLVWSDVIEGRVNWPAFVNAMSAAAGISMIKLAALLLTFIASILTYHFVEKQFRFTKTGSRQVGVLFVTVVVIIPLIALGQIIFDKNFASTGAREKFMAQYDLEIENSPYRLEMIKRYRSDCSFYGPKGEARESIDTSCTQITNRPVIMLWGDSHVQHIRPGVDRLIQEGLTYDGVAPSVIQVTSGSCPPSLNFSNENTNGAKACNSATEFALKNIETVHPEIVILAQASLFLETDWEGIIQKLKSNGTKKIIVVGPFPRWDTTLPQLIASRYFPNIPERISGHTKTVFEDIDRTEQNRLKGIDGVVYVSPIQFFCNELGCLSKLNDPENTLVSHDSGHMTPKASDYFAKNVLKNILQNY